MARAAEHRQRSAGHPAGSGHRMDASALVRGTGPQPIGEFLPPLQTHVRWILVCTWRDGTWQVGWVDIRSLELVHVARNRSPRARRFD